MTADRDRTDIHIHLHIDGEARIMGAVQELGQTLDQVAGNVSQIGTDLTDAVARLDTGIQALRDQVTQGQVDNAEVERALGVAQGVRDDLAGIRDKIVDAGDNADSPIPPVEPPVEEPPAPPEG